jgi:hypothetical protein
MAIQSLMGKTWVSLYPESGKHYQRNLPELDGYDRVIDARASRNVLMVVAVRNGQYDRLIYRFSFRQFGEPEYDVRVVDDIHPAGLNFVVLPTGVAACINEDEELELFAAKRGSKGVKTVADPVLGSDMNLGVHEGKVCFWRGTQVHTMTTR